MSETPQWDFKAVEAKWQKRWAEMKLFQTTGKGDPYYCLAMYPYPSGVLHMGHILNYSISDAMVRYALMQGRDVLTPMGWDSFGLPAENHAIKTQTPPAESTRKSIAKMREQMVRAGFGYDWDREIATSHPGYYQWTQWIFLQLFRNELAEKRHAPVNWCPSCQTVLANEQVEGDGTCERCGTEVEQKDLDQWFFKLKQFAQRLLDGHERLEGNWPDRVLKLQKDWIGRSEGAHLDFTFVAPGSECDGDTLQVFTTRPDTTYGVTFMSIAPEHPLVPKLVAGTDVEKDVLDAVKRMRNQDAITRTAEGGEKEGIFTGRHVRNPFDGSLSQLWVANYVVMAYGSGAVMAVPAHDQRDFEFAKKYGIEIKRVIEGGTEPLTEAHVGEGAQVNSGPFDGIATRAEAITKMTEHAAKEGFGEATINYKLRDWLISRQRYWGAPIPIVYCEKDGIVGLRDEDLPVLLPENVEFRPDGESPLARAKDWVRTTCPTCGGPATRETDTMDTFVDSSWYFMRYLTPRKEDGAFDQGAIKQWLGVHQYVGGIEHATMHLIYARFLTMALHDLGHVPVEEPFARLFCQGMLCDWAYRCEEHKWLDPATEVAAGDKCKHCGRDVQKEMAKMSKTKKNGISPDMLLDKYGADTVHGAILNLGPADKNMEYNEGSVEGMSRFLRRLWKVVHGDSDIKHTGKGTWNEARFLAHEALQKITDTFAKHTFGFNTAISAVMKTINAVVAAPTPDDASEEAATKNEVLGLCVQMISPFAPHVAEELWRSLGHQDESIFRARWPTVDESALEQDSIEIPIRINGKIRAKVYVAPGSAEDAVMSAAQADQDVVKWIDGKEIVMVKWVQDRQLVINTAK